MAHRTAQVLSAPLLGTEVRLTLSTSTNPSHISFRSNLSTSLSLVESKKYYAFFLRHHKSKGASFTSLTYAAKIWQVTATTWSCDEKLLDDVMSKIPLVLTSKSIKKDF